MLASLPGWHIAATPAASGPLLKETAMHRKALTLVEMLVALALTIFLMAILSEAFVTGLRAFRRLKAVADMDQQLRTVTHVLRRDLQADHFEGSRRLSSYTLDQPLASGGFDRPALGYFCVREGFVVRGNVRITSELEGLDTVSRPSFRDVMLADANGQLTPSDALAFTVRLAGNRPEEYFYGAVPLRRAPLTLGPPAPPQPLDTLGYPSGRFDSGLADGRYSSQWAEVVYFLERDGDRTAYDETTNTALPLFRLHRVQLLLVPEAQTVPPGSESQNDGEALNRVEPYAAWDDGSTIYPIEDAVPFDNYFAGNVGQPTFYRHDVSAWAEPQANGRFRYRYNSPADVQFRERRFGSFGGNYRNLGSWSSNPLNNVARLGADILAVNVLSFDIKVYDPRAIRRTLVQSGQSDTIPEFVDLGQGLSQPLPMPQTDGTYTYAWNFGPASLGVASSLFLGPGNNAALPCTFDTWTNRRYADPSRGIDWDYLNTNTSPPRTLPYAGPLQAIQIRIRVWDEKTRQTRELTLIQDL